MAKQQVLRLSNARMISLWVEQLPLSNAPLFDYSRITFARVRAAQKATRMHRRLFVAGSENLTYLGLAQLNSSL